MTTIINFGKRPLAGGRLSHIQFPDDASPELIEGAIRNPPPTQIPTPTSAEDFLSPRSFLGILLFKKNIVSEFLLRGFIEGKDGVKRLPEKGSVPEDEIKAISKCTISVNINS